MLYRLSLPAHRCGHTTQQWLRAARRGARATLLVPLVLASACSTVGDITTIEDVKPWDRDILARNDMQLVSDPMESLVDDHIYFSREASTGGSGVQGGGCGCN